MALRRDSLVTAADVVLAVEQIGRTDEWSRSTCGFMDVYPNSRNVIPGDVRMTVDLRHLDPEQLDALEVRTRAAAEAIARRRGVAITMTQVFDFPPMTFDERCVDAVRAAARNRDVETIDLPSGAGHDAVYLARVVPTAMVFVPCRGGISHNEAESAEPEHLALGCDVLLDAVLDRAGIA